jgi:hypothetical protein
MGNELNELIEGRESQRMKKGFLLDKRGRKKYKLMKNKITITRDTLAMN